MFTANFLWGIMSPISKAIFLTGTISAFSLTNMRMAGAAILLDCFFVYASGAGY